MERMAAHVASPDSNDRHREARRVLDSERFQRDDASRDRRGGQIMSFGCPTSTSGRAAKMPGVPSRLLRATVAVISVASLLFFVPGTARDFFSRPVLRLFVTSASWSGGLRGLVGGLPYANVTSGLAFGVQAENWW